MNEIQEPGVIWVVKMWVIGALLYPMCTIGGFVRGVEGVKIIPGMAAKDFAENEKVDIMVNKLTSIRTQIPLDYYSLPFCVPEGGSRDVKGAVEWGEGVCRCDDGATVVRNGV